MDGSYSRNGKTSENTRRGVAHYSRYLHTAATPRTTALAHCCTCAASVEEHTGGINQHHSPSLLAAVGILAPPAVRCGAAPALWRVAAAGRSRWL